MSRPVFPLLLAISASLMLHLLPFLSDLFAPDRPKPRPQTTPLHAQLQPLPSTPALRVAKPEAKTAPSPPNKAPPPLPSPRALAAPARPANGAAPKNWVQQVRQHLQTLDQRGELYPRESIALGEQGEALVLIILDESGHVVAARLEQSSHFPRLDEAALRAVRTLSALPSDAPREAVIPVRFRLR